MNTNITNKTYSLDVNKIQSFDDMKALLKYMQIRISVDPVDIIRFEAIKHLMVEMSLTDRMEGNEGEQ